MKKFLLFLPLLLLPALAACSPAACDCDAPVPLAAANPAEVQSHPLKGVIVDRLPDRQALLVKHEAVPGVMRAMTMMFKVEPGVLAQVKAGDAITAKMSRREDGWWLTDVVVVPPEKN